MYNFNHFSDAYKKSREFLKKDEVAIFPPYVTFQLVNRCNFQCIMCPVSYVKSNKDELNFELFKKAIDEIAKYGSLIRFIGYSEPFLYSHIKEAITYVKDKNLKLHITTNGSLLNEELIDFIIEKKVDSIVFSFQGLDENEYLFMRNTTKNKFDKLLQNIQNLFQKKDKFPFMKITTTVTKRDNLTLQNEFIKKYLNYVDEVQITGFTHFIHIDEYFNKPTIWSELNIQKPTQNENVKCFLPNYEMLIKHNGYILQCCGAFTNEMKVENIAKNSLYDIWHSKKANEIRQITTNGNLTYFSDCKVCPIRYSYEEISNSVSDLVKKSTPNMHHLNEKVE